MNWHVLITTELVATGLSWPADGLSSFSVYILSGMTHAQVLRTSCSVGRSDAGDSLFESDDGKSGYITGTSQSRVLLSASSE